MFLLFWVVTGAGGYSVPALWMLDQVRHDGPSCLHVSNRHSRVGVNPRGGHDDHVIADLIRNPEVQGRAANKSKPTDRIPLSLDGRGSKPVPVPDTGSRG